MELLIIIATTTATLYLLDMVPVRNRKVGGIRFIRMGRLQFSYCVCRFDPK